MEHTFFSWILIIPKNAKIICQIFKEHLKKEGEQKNSKIYFVLLTLSGKLNICLYLLSFMIIIHLCIYGFIAVTDSKKSKKNKFRMDIWGDITEEIL